MALEATEKSSAALWDPRRFSSVRTFEDLVQLVESECAAGALAGSRAGDLAALTSRARETLVSRIQDLVPRLGVGVGPWLERGLREFGHNDDALVAYLDLESARSLQSLVELERAARVATVRRPFEMVAEALLGEPVTLQETTPREPLPTPASTGEPTRVLGRRTLRLRATVDSFDQRQDNHRFLRSLLVHSIGAHRYGTYDFEWRSSDPQFGARPGFDPDRSQHQNGTPTLGTSTLGFADFYAGFERPWWARRLFTAFENRRIDARLAEELPGYRRDEVRLRRLLLPPGQNLAQVLVRASAGADEADPRGLLGPESLAVVQDLFTAVQAPRASVRTSALSTLALYSLLHREARLEERPTGVDAPANEQPAIEPAEEATSSDTDGVAQQTTNEDHYSDPDSDVSAGAQDSLFGDLDELEQQRQQKLEHRMRTLHALKAQFEERELELPAGAPDELLRPDALGVLSIQDGDLSNAAGLFLHDLDFMDRSDGDSDGSANETAKDLTSWSDTALRGVTAELAKRTLPDFQSFDQTTETFEYEEWDHQIADYRPRHCRLFEKAPAELADHNRDFVSRTLDRHRELLGEVRRQFELLKPEVFRKLRGLIDGEELELDRVIEDHIDRACGLPPREKLYQRRDRQERSVAAAFLVDMSASTDSEVPESEDAPTAPQRASASPSTEPASSHFAARVPGTYSIDARFADDDAVDADPQFDAQFDSMWTWPPSAPNRKGDRRRVIDVEKEAIVLMAEALRTLGDQYAVYGFSGFGRRENHFYVAKDFEEPYDQRAQDRIAALEPRQSTRMGPAIRHAITKISNTEAKIRALIVLSDGYPQDSDYGPDRGDRTYGIQDTMMALREAEQRGIHTFCLTVDPAGHDYLREMCPERRYLVIDDVAALPQELPKVYRAITGS